MANRVDTEAGYVFMNNTQFYNKYALIAVVLILLLMARGNAAAMLILSAIGLIMGFQYFGKKIGQGTNISVALGFTLAIIIIFLVFLKWLLEQR